MAVRPKITKKRKFVKGKEDIKRGQLFSKKARCEDAVPGVGG